MNIYRIMSEFSKEDLIIKSAKIVTDILAMPYYKNYAAASGAVHNFAEHEEAVSAILNQNGIKQYTPFEKKPNKITVWDWINNPMNATSMPHSTYISQPCGTHDSPDFLVKLDEGVVFGIECKSADGYSPMYNSGGIKQKIIYVFCSKRTNKTTMYVGKDIMTLEQQNLITELIQKQKVLEKEYNEKLKAVDINHRGISYGTRPAIQQAGGETFTNYFIHAQREECEKNVLLFINDIIQGET